MQRATAIGALLKRIDAAKIEQGEGEADIEPLMAQGVPGFGLRTVMTHYFDYHHSQADTFFDKIVIPEEFARCAAAMAGIELRAGRFAVSRSRKISPCSICML